jgi:hypothetical protein
MRKRHHMQVARAANIETIRGWITQVKEKNKEAKIDREALLRKICLVIGCTKEKAEDYLNVIGF